MVILDTSVLSELTRLNPSPEVIAWVNRQDGSEVYVTAITKAEIKFGLKIMPEGKRRHDLEKTYEQLFTTLLMRRVLPFEDHCTGPFAHLAASAEKKGRGMSTADLQIAAIAYFFNASIATRNVNDFDHEGLRVINPWTD